MTQGKNDGLKKEKYMVLMKKKLGQWILHLSYGYMKDYQCIMK